MALINAVSCLFLVLLGATSADKQEVAKGDRTPKVLQLLKKFKGDVIAEGTKEAASWKRYSHFCVKEIDEKKYVTARSNKSIARMTTQINALTQDLNSLAEKIQDLNAENVSLTEQLDQAIATRIADAAAYATKAQDMTDAIEALYNAMKAVKDGTGDFVALEQVKPTLPPALARRLALATAKATTSKVVSTKHGEQSISSPAKPTSSKDAGGVIDTLRDLKREFTENKRDLDKEELEAKNNFDLAKQDMTNRLKLVAQDTQEKTATELQKEVKKAQLDKDLEDEQKTFDSDLSFLQELKVTCTEKGEAANQRKTTRESELKALASIIGKLSK